jgi:CDP-glucose 4,6-dehydratase
MRPSFWLGKKVLITGHTGFKGSWLSLWLQKTGANVVGFALAPPTSPNLFTVANVADGMCSVEGDIRNLDQLDAVIRKHKPEIVIHMAAQALVRYSYEEPVETFATNVMGTVNILESVRRSDCVRVILNITSDKCYENKEWLWGYRENEPMGGHDPYSSSKGCAELVTSAYRESYFSGGQGGCVVATSRAGNVIGGGDWAKDRLIPDIMAAFMQKRPVEIRYPESIRPWQHVLEPLNGYLLLIEHLWEHGEKFTGGWNFGPADEDARPVMWIVERLIKLWGDGASCEVDTQEHPHEANYLKLDCSKARQLLKWKPQLNLDSALEWVANWYQEYHRGGNLRDLTEAQITEYQKCLKS